MWKANGLYSWVPAGPTVGLEYADFGTSGPGTKHPQIPKDDYFSSD